jgi:hypothetical protein
MFLGCVLCSFVCGVSGVDVLNDFILLMVRGGYQFHLLGVHLSYQITQLKPKAMSQILEEKSKIYQDMFGHGWTGKTLTTIDGITWEITTMKRHNGVLLTSAQECKASTSGGMQMLTFSPFQDRSVSLIAERVRCTENAVREQHFKALTIFEQKREAGELPKKEKEDILKVGQIIWLNGYGQDQYSHKRLAVYEIENSDYGEKLKCVDIDNFVLSTQNYVRPVSKLFGIGMYWTPGDVADPIEIGEAIKEAKRLIPIRAEENRINKDQENQAYDKEKEALKVKYPFLTPVIERYGKETIKITMENIRAMLKNSFPGIKFSVVHEHYSTVNIRWTDGPTTEQVSILEKMFQDHKSDETGDFWDPCASTFNDLFGGMSFVFCNRDMSKPTEESLITPCTELYEKQTHGCHCVENFIHHIFSVCSLPAGAIVTGIEETGNNSGLAVPETFYKLAFTLPEKPTEGMSEPMSRDGIIVRRNESKNGIEIQFPGKPSNDILTNLKVSGWRWSHFNKVWYNHYSDENLNFANNL